MRQQQDEPGRFSICSRQAAVVLQWKNHVLHAKAQQEGRESIFDFYKISIAHITREYSFKKDKDNV